MVALYMNILFVHEVDLLQKVVFEIHSLSEALSNFGHNVFVIDFEEPSTRLHFFDIFRLKTIVINKFERANTGAPVKLLRPGLIKFPLLDRISALVTHHFEVKNAIEKRKVDVIILYSVPTNGVQTIKLAKKNNIPVIFRSIDVPHRLVPYRALRPIIFSLEKWVYTHVDKILTLSSKLSDYVIRMGADETRVELFLFSVDMKKFKPNIDIKGLREELGTAEEDKVILFMGTLFEFSGLDLYLHQFPLVVEEFPKVKLVIVGGGVLFERLKKLARDLKIMDNVIFTGFQPFDMMPEYINLADVCINPFIINATTRDIIPGKIIQYLSCAKPVLATPLPGMTSLLPGSEQGVVYSNIDDFAKNSTRLLNDSEMAKVIGENGYHYVEDNHNEKRMSRKLDRILNQMIAPSLE